MSPAFLRVGITHAAARSNNNPSLQCQCSASWVQQLQSLNASASIARILNASFLEVTATVSSTFTRLQSRVSSRSQRTTKWCTFEFTTSMGLQRSNAVFKHQSSAIPPAFSTLLHKSQPQPERILYSRNRRLFRQAASLRKKLGFHSEKSRSHKVIYFTQN